MAFFIDDDGGVVVDAFVDFLDRLISIALHLLHNKQDMFNLSKQATKTYILTGLAQKDERFYGKAVFKKRAIISHS